MDILNFRWDSVFLPPGYEILFYTILLLSVWIFVRFIATSCINSAFNFFREPVLKVVPYLNGVIYPVSYWTEKGKRPYQEDRYHIMKATTKSGTILSLYGVFDGHGGYRASQYCKEVLLSSISSNPDWDKSPSAAISSAFFKLATLFYNFRLPLLRQFFLIFAGLMQNFLAELKLKCLTMVPRLLSLFLMKKLYSLGMV